MTPSALLLPFLWSFRTRSVRSLLPVKPWRPFSVLDNRKGMTMYFDDVSRHSIEWAPSKDLMTSSAYHPHSPTHFPSYTEQKLDAIQRMLLGYDAQSASQLSSEEVVHQIELWSTKAGVVGRSFGDELYSELLGSTVCNATNVVTSLAQFWQALAMVIRLHTDEFSPLKWTTSVSETARFSRGREAEKVHFLVFPNCPDLYDYKNMVMFAAAVEFAKESCLYIGKRLTLGIFHPNYKHSPKLLSPERHSPFPVVALQLEEERSNRRLSSTLPKDVTPKRQRGNHIVRRPSVIVEDDDDDDETVQIAYGRILDLDHQRNVLEVLFNSAAVPGSDGHQIGSIGAYDVKGHRHLPTSIESPQEASGDILSMIFQKERQMRRRRLPDETVKEICLNWMNKHRFVDARRTKENRALRWMDTIHNERWTISNEKIAEMVYSDVWKVISDLYEVGKRADQELFQPANDTEQSSSSSAESDTTPLQNQFHFMFRPFLTRPSKTSSDKASRRHVILSSMLVSTKFCAYNAPAFKRFAITVNAALKRLTDGRMFLEVFHNEYVGQDGFDHSLRRSPFPMIQICYEVST